jgi:hypothetical protein
MIAQIKKEREAALEGKMSDRQVKVINTTTTQQNLKNLLFKIDQDEIERLKELNMTEEKMEVAAGNVAAMRFLANNEKNSKF